MKITGKFSDIKTIMDVMSKGITAEMVIFQPNLIKAMEVSRTVFKSLKPTTIMIEGDGYLGISPVEFNDTVSALFNGNENITAELEDDMIVFKSMTTEVSIPNKDISHVVFPPDDLLKTKDGKGYFKDLELPVRLILNTKDIEKITTTIKKLKKTSAKYVVKGIKAEVSVGDNVRGSSKAKLTFNVESTDDVAFEIPIEGYTAMSLPVQNIIVFVGKDTPLYVIGRMNIGEIEMGIAPRVEK